jgi:WD40 repeat protein
LRDGHSGAVRSVVVLSNGDIITGDANSVTRRWDVSAGSVVWEQKSPHDYTGGIVSLAVSASGKLVASTSIDSGQVYEAATGKQTILLSGQVVSFFEDDARILTTLDDLLGTWQTASLRDATTNRRSLYSHAPPLDKNDNGYSIGAALSPRAHIIASGRVLRSEAVLWDPTVSRTKIFRTLNGGAGMIRSLAFSADGTTLVTRSSWEEIILWDVATGVNVRRLKF